MIHIEIIMKYLFFVVVISILASCGEGSDQEKGPSSSHAVSTPVTVQVDSSTLASVASALEAYYQLKDALVEADTAAANKACLQLSALADSIHVGGMVDSALAIHRQEFRNHRLRSDCIAPGRGHH